MRKATAVATRFQNHLIRLGASTLVLSIVPAVVGGFDLAVSAEYAIATHVVMLMIGVLFLCLGLAWHEFKITGLREHFAFSFLVGGGLTVFSVGMLAAVMGIGGEALAAFDPEPTGSAAAERWVRIAVAVAGVLFLAGLGLLAGKALATPDDDGFHMQGGTSPGKAGDPGSGPS